jgi:hypothetical protein
MLFEYPKQSNEIDHQFRVTTEGNVYAPKKMHNDLAHLDGSGSPRQTEECLRALGNILAYYYR